MKIPNKIQETMLNGNGKLVGGADKCPLCASEDIEWGSVELLDGPQLYYPGECKKCGCSFREYHDIAYKCKGHVMDGEGNEVKGEVE